MLAALSTVAQWIADADSVTALTGAGISTESGIPDFRGPQGIWTRNPSAQRLSDSQAYLTDPELRRQAWRRRRDHPAWAARPNAGHRALVDLERFGRLRALITQNIDELHQRAGSSLDRVIELHGTLFGAHCLSCRRRTRMHEELDRLAAGDPDPACQVCGDILTSAIVSFGQALDPAVLDRARAAAVECELFLAIGSSLTVQPAAGLCRLAVRTGARLVIVNAEPTPYDQMALASGGALVAHPIGVALPALIGGLPMVADHA